MARPAYRRELWTSATMPAVIALVEGNVVGVLAKKVFSVTDLQLAIIVAAPMFANLISFFWARLARGRRKIPFITGLIVGTLACVAAIAALPVTPAGAWALTGLVVAARCLTVGIIALRSTLWRHNYPRVLRGRITGRLAMMASFVVFAVPLIGSLLLEADRDIFRILYPAGVIVAALGVISFSGIRMRHERSLLRFESRPDAAPTPHGDAGTIYEYEDETDPPPAVPGFWAVLRRDANFRRYLFSQFLGGTANMMLAPVVIKVAAERTEGLPFDILISTALTQLLPALMMMSTLPFWARRIDRYHIAHFRVGQSALWVISFALMGAGAAWTGSAWAGLGIFAAGRLALGVAQGGGALAWQLGHNDFASREMVAIYMGVHTTLTGLRGAFAPFLGMGLYAGWSAASIGGLRVPAFAGIGSWIFALAAALAVCAMIGFESLRRRVGAPDLSE